jgi:phage shock protein C
MQRQGLFRSRADRVFGGVAGGIARSLNADPAIIRIIFALLIIFGGGGILLYLILWIAIPEEPIQFFQETLNNQTPGPSADAASQDPPSPAYPARKNQGTLIGGLILIVVGAIFLIIRFMPHLHVQFRDLWPIVIVIAGITLIYSSFTGTKKT